jgi:RimJ/RimL family protein N-acetyltransferase
VTLAVPTADQCELVRHWRNAPDVLRTLRTRDPLTAEQQAAFYRTVICNPASSRHRYYALLHLGAFVGLGGLTYLDRVPQEGEISLILDPLFRQSGLGGQAVHLLRAEGARLGLEWIVGECYDDNPAQTFWVKQVVRCDGYVRYEPGRLYFRMRAGG